MADRVIRLFRRVYDPGSQEWATGSNVACAVAPTSGSVAILPLMWTAPGIVGDCVPSVRFTWSDSSTATFAATGATCLSGSVTGSWSSITGSDGAYVGLVEFVVENTGANPDTQTVEPFELYAAQS